MEKHLKLLESYLFFIWQTMSFIVPVIKTWRVSENFQIVPKHIKTKVLLCKIKNNQDSRLNMP
jgi:hypothetical protein